MALPYIGYNKNEDHVYDLGRRASKGGAWAAGTHGLTGTGLGCAGAMAVVLRSGAPAGTATRSHEGHMVSVVGGAICM